MCSHKICMLHVVVGVIYNMYVANAILLFLLNILFYKHINGRRYAIWMLIVIDKHGRLIQDTLKS